MKYKIIFSVLLIILAVTGGSIYYNNRSFNNNDIEIETLVSNNTWDTNFTDKVFFKKGDKIEYVYVIKNISDKKKKISVNTGNINRDYGFENAVIELQDTIISGEQATILKISGITSTRGDTASKLDLINQIVKFENINIDTPVVDNSIIITTSNSTGYTQVISEVSSDIDNGTTSVTIGGPSISNSDNKGSNNANNTNITTSVNNQPSTNTDNSSSNTGSSNIQTGVLLSGSTNQYTGTNSPNNSSTKKTTFSSDIDNLMKIDSAISNVKSVGIGEKFFNLITVGTENYIFIPKKTFSTGKYFMSYILNNGEMLASNDEISFDLGNKPVEILTIFPNKFPNNTDRWITVQGIGLKKTVSVQLSNNTIFKRTDFQIVSDNVLAVKIPINIDIGTYYINIMTLDGIYEFPNRTFNIYFKSN